MLHVGPPCSSFSMAVNRFLSQRIRSRENPEGLGGLRPDQQEKVIVGNHLAEISITLARAQMRVRRFFQLEQPASSLMLQLPSFRKLLADPSVHLAARCVCVDGAPWRKPTAVIANSSSILKLNADCPGCKSHIVLQGKAPDGRSWTSIASSYWPAFARAMAKSWEWAKQYGQSREGTHLAG